MLTTTKKATLLPVIWALAWPTMLEQLMQTAVQYVDTAMVGSLGTAATAAVGSTTTVNWLVGSTISALGVGFLATISQARGAGRHEDARRASGQAVLAVLVTGLLFTLLCLLLAPFIPGWMQVEKDLQPLAGQYFFILYTPMLARVATIIFGTVLRAAGDTKTPMKAGVWVNLINVSLNFLLIYPTRRLSVLGITFTCPGAGWGVSGAAVASAIAVAVGGIILTVKLWQHKEISPRGQSIRPDWQVLRPCLRVALPNALQRFGTSLGYVAFASMVNALGGIATAAHTVANTVESAFYIPGYGMQAAAATLAGNALGARDAAGIRRLPRTILAIEVALMMVSGTLLFIFAPNMVGLFSTDPRVILLGATVLQMVAVSEPFYGVSIIIEGMMQGMGHTVYPFVCNILGMWGVRIVGTWLFTTYWGGDLTAAWGCMIAHNLLLFALFVGYYLSGHWNPLRYHKETE